MNKEKIIKIIKETKESLRLIKETQAFDYLLKKNTELDNVFVENSEKELEDLLKQEEDAMEQEDFIEYKKVKESQKEVVKKLTLVYKRKTETYEKMLQELLGQLQMIDNEGDSVFKNKEVNEFKNENSQKGQVIKIVTNNYEFTLQKINDNNVYQVIDGNIEGVQNNDYMKLPDLKIGSGGIIKVYRKVDGKYEDVKDFTLENVRKLIKNPK